MPSSQARCELGSANGASKKEPSLVCFLLQRVKHVEALRIAAPGCQETDLFEDEILVKGRRWGGLSEFQASWRDLIAQIPHSMQVSGLLLRRAGCSVEVQGSVSCGLIFAARAVKASAAKRR